MSLAMTPENNKLGIKSFKKQRSIKVEELPDNLVALEIVCK